MVFNELDNIITKVEKNGIPAGFRGMIVHVYEKGEAYEVEIVDKNLDSLDIVTYKNNELELYKKK
ncbi:hypothetical protein FACS189459_7070 [Bacilli bacterium]|nr:hypothetical protein FACS189459_7070 [Bacilli bacterium]